MLMAILRSKKLGMALISGGDGKQGFGTVRVEGERKEREERRGRKGERGGRRREREMTLSKDIRFLPGLFFRLTLGHVGTETVGWEDSRQSMNRESLAIDRGECEEKIRSGWMLWTKCHPKLIH